MLQQFCSYLKKTKSGSTFMKIRNVTFCQTNIYNLWDVHKAEFMALTQK